MKIYTVSFIYERDGFHVSQLLRENEFILI